MSSKRVDIHLKTKADTSGATKMQNFLSTFRKGVIFSFGDSLVKSIGSTLKGSLGNIFGGVAKSINSSFKFESQTVQFKSLIGDIEEAKRHMQDLKELGDTPPFGLEQFAEASRALMRMTDGVLGYKKSLEMIGDVAAATGYPIEELGQAVGRMYAFIRDGQPLSRAVQQLRNMGVITPEVAQKLQDLQAAGKSNAEIWAEVEAQLGRYKGAMAETEKTGEGLMGAIKSRWDNIVRQFGMALMDDAKGGLEAVNDAAKDLEESGTIEVWANNAIEKFREVKEVCKGIGDALTWLWDKSGASDIYHMGMAQVKSVTHSATRAVAGLANGEGMDALKNAWIESGQVRDKEMAKGYYIKQLAESGYLGKGLQLAAADNAADAEYESEREEEIREKAKDKRIKRDREIAEREAAERKRIEDNLVEAQLKKEEADKIASARKIAEEAKKAELKAAKEKEKLEKEAHARRMNNIREEIEAYNKYGDKISNTISEAKSEFDSAFAMYRDPEQAASVINEEKDYREDLDRLHRDASRYGGKWRIDELSRLMAAGDSQGVSDTLATWRKSKSFSPEIEAMVRASAAERTKTTAEDELRKIENNTAGLARKLDELLTMKGD